MRGVTLSPAIGKWQQSLQMLLSSLQPGIAFSTQTSILWLSFLQSFSWPWWPVRENGVQLLSLLILLSFSFTFTFAKQGKHFGPNGHMVTYGGFGCRSDMFRCRFGCRSYHVGFPSDKFAVNMQPLEKAAEQLSFQQSWFAYCCLKQRMFWQSLWRPGSQPTAQRWLPTPLPERSFRCQI